MTTPNQTPENPSPAAAAPAPAAANGNGKRRSLLIGVTIALIIVLIAYGIWWFIYARHYENTDDAYVGGNVVQVTPQVGGTVLAINTDDTELVQAGKPLVELDKADAKVALDQAEAQLAQTVRQVRTLFVNNNALVSNVTARTSELERARADLARRQQLISTGAVSKEELDHAKVAVQGAEAALQATREQLASNRVLTDHTTVEQHPNVQNAAAQVRNAYINLARTTLLAPTTGYVAKRSVQVGQRIAAGTPLLSIVPLNALWVDANFKEVQINNMRIGQPVTLKSDLYGSKIEYHGKVVGLAAGTGSAFALLPAQNASGNWIKIVQRIPVRISLDAKDLETHPLRIGVSMDATVDIAQTEGTSLTAGTARTTPAYTTDVFDKSGQEADARIASIIAANNNAAAAH
ncbi:HlyD family efflux transporter periplasmic adaptor subunit [Collimonas fungivorans]|uniref:Membrane fusion component of tripartite multidrug resistance system n=1 Tax=Collimonas fungivorans (strain Ter331) TaxID=1005048 RepID=G0AH60_COLFT|nr:HlyD family efflux transporter periplasmic adaptor subunit [Collimonas fungivorans]AEK62304.1 Membrane fusion component of tripartite multidrug resistance system [Collimonas fungivorans Ter331]